MEDAWLTAAKRIQSIASTGLSFDPNPYDKERYEEVANIAHALLARLGDSSPSRIRGLVDDFARGYATPKIDVRGAVIRENSILLVRERADGLWTLPGGFAEVGVSPAENVVKEIREEAGIEVDASRLYAVRHKARHGYDPDPRDFYKLFFLCTPRGEASPVAGMETTDVAFFSADLLPPLSTSRTIEEDIRIAFDFDDDHVRPTLFD